MRAVLGRVLAGVLLLGLTGCAGSAPRTDSRLAQLQQSRRQLEDQRAAVVRVYGPRHRATRLVEHQLQLMDEQIALRRAAVEAGAPRQGG